jgi:hypothetical protein
MFTKELTQAGHIMRFVLTEAGWNGWEIRVEQDSAIVSRAHYSDWHRVERALKTIQLRVSELEAGGWRDTLAVQ